MADNFFYLLFWDLAVFVLSLLMELLLKPRPCFARPFFAWLFQFGLFTVLFAVFALILGRPVCAAGLTLAIYLILILVNNAKYESLREPFLYHDYDYFLDVVRFPRLYLPFLGVKNFALCALGFLAALAGLMLEPAPESRFSINGQAGAALIILAVGAAALFIGSALRSPPSYIPLADYKNLGYAAFLYSYGLDSRNKINIQAPAIHISRAGFQPNLVAVQSESFFDPRELDPELSPDALQNLDRFKQQAFLRGFLEVPAWGANTVRTEFSFLTGIDLKRLGPHQFNPYRAMLAGWIPESLPSRLKAAGYETICLHPWHDVFYGRKRLFPNIGFNKFLDLKAFSDCRKSGAYTDDRDLADKLLSALSEAQKPVFIFVITMENHGPLQEDAEARKRIEQSSLRTSWPAERLELPIYIDHLVHADLMLARLHKELSAFSCPVSLCFYGDHVPIMPLAYKFLGYPKGDTPYFCWRNYNGLSDEAAGIEAKMKVSDLARAWLEGSGLAQGGLSGKSSPRCFTL